VKELPNPTKPSPLKPRGDWTNDGGKRVKLGEGHSIAGSATPKYDNQDVSDKDGDGPGSPGQRAAVSPAKVLPRS
jgi:hypothetical protein